MTIEHLDPGYPTDAGSSGAQGREVLDLWYYAAILRRKWWLIVSTSVITLGMAWWGQRDYLPEYTAEALLQQVADETATSPWGFAYGSDMASHLDIIRSSGVLSPVVDSLGLQLRLKSHRDRRTALIASFKTSVSASLPPT